MESRRFALRASAQQSGSAAPKNVFSGWKRLQSTDTRPLSYKVGNNGFTR